MTDQKASSPETLPRITVVTPSFNQVAFLEEAMRSVLDQGYPNLEYIVLDAGSGDGSADVIRRHADRLTYWRSAPDDGQAAALREGFARATGDILTWLNSDDRLDERALWTVAEVWARHGGNVIIAGACQTFDEKGARRRHLPSFQRAFDRPESMPLERILDLARHWFPGEFYYQPEVFFPRSAYESIGGVDPSFYYTMDFDLWARFALEGTPVVVIDETLAWFREHDQQKTADKAALHQEMILTANAYLEQAPLPDSQRERLQRWNRYAGRPLVREAFKLRRRLLG